MELKILFVLTCITAVQCKLISLSCGQIRAFVDGHNTRRLLIARGKVPGQPAASEMKMMTWDEELAAKASQWAKKNLHQHNPDKSVGSNRFTAGENLYWYSTTNPKYVLQPDSAVNSWFSENVNYTYAPLQMSDFQKDYDIGHYTQMVWSDSIYLGCAMSQTLKNGWNKYFVVCNYGPGGNYLGQKPYKESYGRSNKLVCSNKSKCDRPYGTKCKKNS
ncbi:hypothetical protein PYW08_001529 [Mythimna loreyi]|uniref:Uncharacterized protein n=1 Tax=Mythimna loreyi TaxID=667449 RepID=A0ACC2R4X4_9NEOP|nr:hypothetical protein PYW08_001529 [Mythimna loreyi]